MEEKNPNHKGKVDEEEGEEWRRGRQKPSPQTFSGVKCAIETRYSATGRVLFYYEEKIIGITIIPLN